MKKKIEDYLYLYMGHEFVTNNSQGEVNHKTLTYILQMCKITPSKNIQLVLRPLSDLTKKESKHLTEAAIEGKPTIFMNAELTHYFIRQGFDVFGLIDAGLAINKTTL